MYFFVRCMLIWQARIATYFACPNALYEIIVLCIVFIVISLVTTCFKVTYVLCTSCEILRISSGAICICFSYLLSQSYFFSVPSMFQPV